MSIQHPNQLRGVIAKEKLKSYHEVSTFKGIFSIIFEWLLIFIVAYFCEKYFYWHVYLFSVIFIGARLLALGLIMHEGVHNLISKNQRINDVLSEVFCAWPLFISMRSYRVKHLAHHKWLNTDLDPDYIAKTDINWRYPMQWMRFVKVVLIQLSGFGIFETFKVMSSSQMKINKAKTPIWYHLCRIFFYFTIITSFVVYGKGLLLVKYWIIPFATWTQVANRLRRIAEHSGIEGKNPSMQTRTTTHGFLAHFFLAPKNISYHNEHHLYPGIPCYFLPKLHSELIKNEGAKDSLHISKSYIEVLKDCVVKNG